MPTSQHTFIRCSTDDSDEQRPGTDYVAGVNLHLELGQVFPATGNVLVAGLIPPDGVTLGLGGFPDGSTGTAINFYYNSAGAHRLVRYDPTGNGGAGSETVLLEWPGLNLSAELVLQGGIIENLLTYLDANGEVRCVNLARAAAGVYTPAYLAAEPYALHVTKTPPRAAPFALRSLGTTGNPSESLRIIQNKAYQFSYRYRYDDGELTVLAPYSAWLDVLYDPAAVIFNMIQVNLPTAPAGVQELEVLVREPSALIWQVADTLRRPAGGAMPTTFLFYGQLKGAAVPNAEATRLFESLWPAKALGIGRSRLFAADLTEGYVTPEPAFTTTVIASAASATTTEPLTFHEGSTYRIAVQYYDALGRSAGCSQPRTVLIPPQSRTSPQLRRVRVSLTTTNAAALNAEIPAWAASVQFLVAPNDRTPHFIQGRAADAFAYFGIEKKPSSTGELQEYVALGDVTKEPHQQVAFNIGNFVPVGQGYVWQPGSGDVVRVLNEQKEFLIVGQRGDYIFCNWTGYPDKSLTPQGYTTPLIEIYSPNTTPLPTYYERGPVVDILRDYSSGTEQRSYALPSVDLLGDVFLIPLFFPIIDRGSGNNVGDVYDAPNNVRFKDDPTPVLVESMVPVYRLAPTRTTSKTQSGAGLFNTLATQNQDVAALLGTNPLTSADTTTRTGSDLRWLDMEYGGRAGEQIPLALQRVRRNIERFSGQKQQGNLINGLSRWEALNQYDKFPQELGYIVALVLADQSQTDGSVLITLQERGIVSQYLGQRPIKTGANEILIANADQVIGDDNTLKGGFGCTDPASVTAYAGKVFWWCRERAELVRYHNGLTPLGLTYKFRFRLQALAAQYAAARVTGCFDPRRQEYWLTFQPIGELPGVTVAWSERSQAWVDAYAAVPGAGLGVGNELVTWDGSDLYRHTPTAPSETFFGVKTPASVTFVAAQPGAGLAKTFQQVGVRSQANWVPALLTTPIGQRSRILPSWPKFIQGVWRAAVRRDENSPGALHGGRVLQAESLRVTLVCPDTTPAPLVGASVDFLLNAGQQPNQ